jgi:hypothetical protein
VNRSCGVGVYSRVRGQARGERGRVEKGAKACWTARAVAAELAW